MAHQSDIPTHEDHGFPEEDGFPKLIKNSNHRNESSEASGWSRFDPAMVRNLFLLLLVMWLLVASAYSGAVSSASGISGLDFNSFYQAAHRLNASQPLYQPHLDPSQRGGLYVYSPLLAELMRPVAKMSFRTAVKVWFFVNAAALILAVLFYGMAARLTWRNISLLAVLLIVSFRFWDTTMNFGLGQSNSVMLALIGAMLWADSRQRWTLMGLLIALAALAKIWLIGLLLYLLLRRQWKAALLGASGYIGVLAALFFAVNWSEFPGYVQSMKQAKAFGEEHAVRNSVLGFADLHLRINPLVFPLVSSPVIYAGFITLCAAGLLWGFITLWGVLRAPSPPEARLAFGLVLASVLLMLPSYENGYLVYCFPLLWTLLASPDLDEKRISDRQPQWISRFMVVSGILIYLVFSRSWPVYAPFPPAYQHGLRSLIVSMSFYGTVLLWFVGLFCLNKLRSEKRMATQKVHPV